jgi:hypothetical protein
MKSFLIAVAALIVVGSVATFVRAADDEKKPAGPVTGVLIDQACGEKQMSKPDPQAAAAKHPKSCCMKEACAESGYAVISGKKMYKFDDNGNKLAKEYLAKSDSKTDVSVEGTVKDDGTMAVTAINAAPAKS